ncbi:hypothetical protein GCM10022261_01950 [Brevibacterium daeguense]|uniref:ANTAR domain-containing protein n=1 Tax=Brevibacterium daeguense TaxID=909936 RepID=A0ABP8EFH9_9MICO|nr:hypothetical protein [Brevibacterium daeguense]
MKELDENEQARRLALAIDRSRISIGALWLRYFSIGGTVGETEVEAYVRGAISLPGLERDMLAHAANELVDEMPPPPRAPYRDSPSEALAEYRCDRTEDTES